MPATDEVYRLQTDDDADCRLFRRMVRGDAAPSHGTLQGIYVCTPNGERLGGLNSLSADAVARMLTTALERWSALPGDARESHLALTAPGHRWEDSCPTDGLVLVRTARDLADAADPGAEPLPPSNRDYVWFTASEARRWLPDELRPGAAADVPQALVARLARFHLVDNVRGQTLPFADSEVEGRARCEVVAVDGDVVSVRISGATQAAADAWQLGDNYWKPNRTWPHGVRTRLLARARWDRAQQRFAAFDLVALGVRWGRTINNGRHGDATPGAIGFALRIDPARRRTAPTFVNVYDADWVKQPQR